MGSSSSHVLLHGTSLLSCRTNPALSFSSDRYCNSRSRCARHTSTASLIAITCIHDDVHTGERVLIVVGIDAFADIVSKMLGIGSHEIKVGTMTRCTIIREISLFSDVEYGSDILTVESTFRSEEFESVTVERQMTCSHHY